LRALAACAGAWLIVAGCQFAGDETAPTGARPGARQIVALGRLKPAAGVREISAIPGDVLQRLADGVREGEVVAAGAELARVKSYDLRATQLEAANKKLEIGRRQREREIALAQANLQQALAAQAEVEAKLDEIEAQGNALATAAEAAGIARTDYESLVALQTSDPALVTQQQLRRQRNLADQATQEYQVKQRSHDAAHKAAEAAVDAAVENVEVARLNYQLAQEVDPNAVAEIERRVAAETVEQSILRAPKTENGPRTFTVLKVLMEPGEIVTQVPVMQIADVTEMVCVAEVYEADAKEIAAGQKAIIHSPALSEEYALKTAADGTTAGGIAGEVVRVGTMVSSGDLIQRNPLAPSDRSIIEVLIRIDPDDEQATAEAAAHIGMQVTVYFAEKPDEAQPTPSDAERTTAAYRSVDDASLAR
jgi:HlyD family secretion protein